MKYSKVQETSFLLDYAEQVRTTVSKSLQGKNKFADHTCIQ